MVSDLPEILKVLDGVILGKEQVVRLAVACMLARGHLLIEDVPGVGKTTLAHALAKVFGLEFRRMQFTSDLLPADLLGSMIFDVNTREFVFHKGPIFTQMLLADEVNRATPKAQSALLEAMEEGQVSIEGTTHPLPESFFVIATQNPQRQIGTYPLPESQLDRFFMRVEVGFPGRTAEKEMLAGQERREMIFQLGALVDRAQFLAWQNEVRAVYISDRLREYILDLVEKSRAIDTIGRGLSPRAGLALQRAAQSWAFINKRTAALPEDVQLVAPSVIAHRLSKSDADGGGHALVEAILRSVPVR